MTGPLVVGYGNALRGDDGLGWHAAELLAEDPRLAGTTVLQRHQLMPELAVDVSAASLVVLVDADESLPAGRVAVTTVGREGHSSTSWSHHFSPTDLVALAQDLYGNAPEVMLVSAGVASTDGGDQLSPAVAAALPHLTDVVADLVAERSSESGSGDLRQRSHA